MISSISKERYRLSIFGYFFCQGICFASWASRIPTIKQNLHLSEAQLGTMLLMLPIGQLITMPLSGKLVTKLGSAKVIAFTSVVYALIMLSIWWIQISNATLGFIKLVKNLKRIDLKLNYQKRLSEFDNRVPFLAFR